MELAYAWHSDWLNQLSAADKGQSLLLTSAPQQGLVRFTQQLTRRLMCDVHSECGRCKACRFTQSDSHPDVYSLWPEGAALMHKIDTIRAIADAAMSTTHQGAGRVIRIFQAERMNQSAANGLLKVLEEPPEGTRFILTSELPGRLPATIKSRCRQVALPTMTDADTFANQLAGSRAGELLQLTQAPEALEQLAGDPEMANQRLQWRRQLDQVLAQQAQPDSLANLFDKKEPLVWLDDWLLCAIEHSKSSAVAGQQARLDGLVRFQERLNKERQPLLAQIKVDGALLVRALGDLWVRVGRLS